MRAILTAGPGRTVHRQSPHVRHRGRHHLLPVGGRAAAAARGGRGRAAPSRARRLRHHAGRPGGPGAHAAVDHRPGRRPPADRHARARAVGGGQRRDLQLRRTAPRIHRAQRRRAADPLGLRKRAAGLRRRRRAGPAAPERHVRAGAARPRAPACGAGARPPGHQAAVRVLRRHTRGLRLGAEGAAAAAAHAAGAGRGCDRAVPGERIPQRRAHRLRRHPARAAGPCARHRPRAQRAARALLVAAAAAHAGPGHGGRRRRRSRRCSSR